MTLNQLGQLLVIGTLTTAACQSSISQSVLEANESNLWYGDNEGIEIVSRTGENLAYTEEDPKINPVITIHARKMDQALLKIGERSYLAHGWAITSPMMVVGDDGLIIIDPQGEAVHRGIQE